MKTIKMRSLVILVAALVVSISASAFMQEKIKASATYTTRNVKVSNFDAIELIGSPDVYFEQSTNGTHSVEVYGSDNLLDLIEVNVSGKTLKINMKKNTQIEFGKAGKLHVKVASPDIRSAYIKGSGDILLNSKIQTPELTLRIEGSGDIKSKYPLSITNSFIADVKGSGDIKLEDNTQAGSCKINIQGSGDIKANQISANSGQVNIKGSGDIEIKNRCAIQEIQIGLEGSGDVKVYGIESQKVDASIKGSGDIVLKGNTREATFTLHHSGDLKADQLKAQHVNATAKGSGRIKCYATDHLKAEVNGSGVIRYKGNPQVETKGRKENIKPL